MKENLRIIISGGGTGGHIFPAVSIANAIKEICPDADILFVGAEGRMEMQRVPAAGYPIKGLPIAGFDRKNPFKNIPVLIKLFKSQRMAKQIIKEFQPHAAVGVGGYASGPTLKVAGNMGIPTLLHAKLQSEGNMTKLMVMQEEMKMLPFGDIWMKYCEECGVAADESWFAEVMEYEKEVLEVRK